MEQDAAFRPRQLHPFERDASLAKTSYRLYLNQRAVGMAKCIGGGYFFSRDGGFAWTGQEIPADTWAMASCLRDRKNRVLHSGDLVLEKGSSRLTRGIVVVDDHKETWLYQPRSRQLEKIDAYACRPRWSKMTFVESSSGVARPMREQIDHALGTLHLARSMRGSDVLAFVATILISGLASGMLSWFYDGQVGFLTPLAAIFLSSWGLHRLQMMGKHRLSRTAMLALTHRVALISGTLIPIFLLSFNLLGAEPAGGALRVFVVAWIASVFGCGVLCLLSGDLATWQSGGYPGEGISK